MQVNNPDIYLPMVQWMHFKSDITKEVWLTPLDIIFVIQNVKKSIAVQSWLK